MYLKLPHADKTLWLDVLQKQLEQKITIIATAII